MSQSDPYRDWDAAYVLGSLSVSERLEYERHLTACDDCTRDVAELADMGGILSVVPADRAMALLDADPTRTGTPPGLRLVDSHSADVNGAPRHPPRAAQSGNSAPGAIEAELPPAMLPKVIELATSNQARRRRRGGAIVAAAAACVALAVTLVLPRFTGDDSRSPAIVLAQTVVSPVTAEARLVPEPWGTTIEITCRYRKTATSPPGVTPGSSLAYDLYVTDTDGVATKQATWTASPGVDARPSATTELRVNQIARIDIRLGGSDMVLLEAEL